MRQFHDDGGRTATSLVVPVAAPGRSSHPADEVTGQPGSWSAVGSRHSVSCDAVADHPTEHVRSDRLGQEVHGPEFHGGHRVRNASMRRDDHHGRVVTRIPQLLQGLHPPHPGHLQVEQHHVGCELIKTPGGPPAVPASQFRNPTTPGRFGTSDRMLGSSSTIRTDAVFFMAFPLSRATGSPLLDGRSCLLSQGIKQGSCRLGMTSSNHMSVKVLRQSSLGQSLAYVLQVMSCGMQGVAGSLHDSGGLDIDDRESMSGPDEFTDAMTQHSGDSPRNQAPHVLKYL